MHKLHSIFSRVSCGCGLPVRHFVSASSRKAWSSCKIGPPPSCLVCLNTMCCALLIVTLRRKAGRNKQTRYHSHFFVVCVCVCVRKRQRARERCSFCHFYVNTVHKFISVNTSQAFESEHTTALHFLFQTRTRFPISSARLRRTNNSTRQVFSAAS